MPVVRSKCCRGRVRELAVKGGKYELIKCEAAITYFPRLLGFPVAIADKFRLKPPFTRHLSLIRRLAFGAPQPYHHSPLPRPTQGLHGRIASFLVDDIHL